MRIVVEVDGLYALPDGEHEDRGATVRYLRTLQAESDEAWAADPEDGQGALSLSTPHMGMNARIVGALLDDTDAQYCVSRLENLPS